MVQPTRTVPSMLRLKGLGIEAFYTGVYISIDVIGDIYMVVVTPCCLSARL